MAQEPVPGSNQYTDDTAISTVPADLNVLLAVSAAMTSGQDLPCLLEMITSAVGQVLPCDSLAIYELDEEGQDLVPLVSGSGAVRPSAVPAWESIIGAVTRSGHAQLINNAHLDPRAYYPSGVAPYPESMIVAPLVVDGRATGALVASRFGGVFVPRETGILLLFAGQVALALSTTRMATTVQRHIHIAEALRKITLQLQCQNEPATLMDTLVRSLAELFETYSATIYLVDEASGAVQLAATTGAPARLLAALQEAAHSYIAKGAAEMVRQTDHLPEGELRAALQEARVVVSLAVPLCSAETMVGVLVLQHRTPRRYTTVELGHVEDFATQAASALVRARLLDALQRRTIALEHRVRQAEWLRQASTALAMTRSVAETVQVLYTSVREGLGYDRVGICLVEPGAATLTEYMATDEHGSPFVPHDRVIPLDWPELGRLWPDMAALRDGQDYYYFADRWSVTAPEARPYLDGQIRENLVVGLRVRGQFRGLIAVDNLVTGRPIAPDDAAPLLTFANQAAIAVENAQLLEQTSLQAMTDPLTGLHNRRFLMEFLAKAVAEHARTGNPLTVLLLDLDHFKQINDSYGHQAGDEALQAMGRLLQEVARAADLVARYGGEEFVAVLWQTDLAGALILAERLRLGVAGLMVPSAAGLALTVSIGVACTADEASPELEALLRQADHALYTAKQHGRNRVSLASKGRYSG